MTAEIICVGTEILLGNIVNTNAAYLAEKLAASGLDCYYQTVVGDNAERLAGVLKCAMERSDRKSTRLNSSHVRTSRMPSSA